jgi:hypothetical protein
VQEPARQLKANLKLQGQPCPVCSGPFELGVNVSTCTECASSQHTTCWEQHGGCSAEECMNAPLKQLDEPAAHEATSALPPDTKRCHACKANIPAIDEICMCCKAIVTPDGVYRGPRENAPGATASLVYGILGLFLCGIIFGIVAINKSNAAKQLIAGDPRFGGEGLASAGKVLGIISIVLWVLVTLGRIATIGGP